jgi:hypothetical protein
LYIKINDLQINEAKRNIGMAIALYIGEEGGKNGKSQLEQMLCHNNDAKRK